MKPLIEGVEKPLIEGRGDFEKMGKVISLWVGHYSAATKVVEKFFKWMTEYYYDLPEDLPERARSVVSENFWSSCVRIYSGTFPFFSAEGPVVVTGYELFIWLVTLRIVLDCPDLVDILGHDVEAASADFESLRRVWDSL